MRGPHAPPSPETSRVPAVVARRHGAIEGRRRNPRLGQARRPSTFDSMWHVRTHRTPGTQSMVHRSQTVADAGANQRVVPERAAIGRPRPRTRPSWSAKVKAARRRLPLAFLALGRRDAHTRHGRSFGPVRHRLPRRTCRPRVECGRSRRGAPRSETASREASPHSKSPRPSAAPPPSPLRSS